MCEENKKLITEFINYKIAARGIGILRQEKYYWFLCPIAEAWDQPFSNLKPRKRDDKGLNEARNKVADLLGRLYESRVKRKDPSTGRVYYDKERSQSAKKDYYIVLKSFYQWYVGRKHPEEFDLINIPKVQRTKIRSSELLTPEDVEKLSQAGHSFRDMLLPHLLFESGARIEEIMTLTLKDIEPLEDGTYIMHINKSKKDSSGQMAIRSIVLSNSAGSMKEWLRVHPRNKEPTAALFVACIYPYCFLSYNRMKKIMEGLKERSGIEKKCNFHFFRKSATSYLRNVKKMNDAAIKTRHGWRPASNMLDIYATDNQETSNKQYLEAIGGPVERKEIREPTIIEKPYKTENPMPIYSSMAEYET
jgi:integrase